MSRRLLALVAATAALAGCSAGGDAPEGLSEPATTASASAPAGATDEPTPSDDPDTSPAPQDEPRPSPTFTQPFLPPDEQSVIDLPAELVIEPPDDATDDERAVLVAAGRFMASWDAILFGAGDEQSDIFATSVEPQLGRLLNYLVESVSKQRVIVGEPTVIELRSVSVTAETAEVDICTVMRHWVQYTGGTPEPQPEVERLLLTMTRDGDGWRASDTAQADPEPCA
ncbi:hypothetical protein [Jiangella mangrovi]|uniref:Lipoprotein n=1 Tax=Jiangella mangrovi TaxID=1524084 RepID=A0A7W9GQN8_9ACTN|nr:hypothetical protein [Jiangella mangrovi]MBB5788255.1 hypothetical protein [Jiangella mangrovi]